MGSSNFGRDQRASFLLNEDEVQKLAVLVEASQTDKSTVWRRLLNEAYDGYIAETKKNEDRAARKRAAK